MGKPRVSEKPYKFSAALNPAILTGRMQPGPAVFVNLDPDPSGCEPLNALDFDKLNTATFQDGFKRGSGTTQYLVLLDPWQNPYHYREWASIRQLVKDGYMTAPSATRAIVAAGANTAHGQKPVASAVDNIHSPDSYDIWSNGPNGVNEYGAPGSDDVTSWSN